jgi:hypothetical protein
MFQALSASAFAARAATELRTAGERCTELISALRDGGPQD